MRRITLIEETDVKKLESLVNDFLDKADSGSEIEKIYGIHFYPVCPSTGLDSLIAEEVKFVAMIDYET